jgi:putative phosphoesterase
MSKVLIVSDSHGLTKELKVLRQRHLDEVDLLIHCGDSELMPDDLAMSAYLTVRGNCDFGEGYPLETMSELSGLKFLITHGHRYSVKNSLRELNNKAQAVQADIVCYGHSHILAAEVIDGTLFINPGSIRLPREPSKKTYVILDLLDDKIKMAVFESAGREIADLACEFILEK